MMHKVYPFADAVPSNALPSPLLHYAPRCLLDLTPPLIPEARDIRLPVPARPLTLLAMSFPDFRLVFPPASSLPALFRPLPQAEQLGGTFTGSARLIRTLARGMDDRGWGAGGGNGLRDGSGRAREAGGSERRAAKGSPWLFHLSQSWTRLSSMAAGRTAWEGGDGEGGVLLGVKARGAEEDERGRASLLG